MQKEKVAQGEEVALQVVEEKVKGMRSMVETTAIDSDESLKSLADSINAIKKLGKWIVQEKEKYTKPAQEIIKNARAKYLPYEKECKDAETALKKKAEEYMDEVEKKRIIKEDRIAARVDKGTMKEDTGITKLEELGEEKKTVSTTDSQIQRRTIRNAYIVDYKLIPLEYWVVDENKVKKAALSGVKISGVEVRDESSIAIKNQTAVSY